LYQTSVIKRLLALISHAAHLIAEGEAWKRQAQSASQAASSLLKETKTQSKDVNSMIGLVRTLFKLSQVSILISRTKKTMGNLKKKKKR
jgi:hypothetical protein